MQCYAKLYRRKYESAPIKKLGLIRRVLRSNISQTLMLAAITVIMEASSRK